MGPIVQISATCPAVSRFPENTIERLSRWRCQWLPGRGTAGIGIPSGGPDPGKPIGAVPYAVVGGLIVWLLMNILPHVHVSITWH